MKTLTCFLLALAVSGCAVDNYTVDPTGSGSQPAMTSDLSACKAEAQYRYAHAFWTPQRALGVAVGGAIGGAVASTGQTNADANPDNINRNVESCMARKGYTGHSSG